MFQTTTLKRNLILEIGRKAKKKVGIRLSGFRYLGFGIWVATTLKRKIPLGGILMFP
jgi:hypothetical protein